MPADTAQSLIERALKLINVPGRGATLSADDLTDAFDTLQDILGSAAVRKQFQPAIARHFFALDGRTVLTYGPGGDLDTDPFDDGAPILIEAAHVRTSVAITDHEQVGDYDFAAAASWTLTGGWSIANDVATAAGVGVLSQALPLVAGTAYVLRISVSIEAGDVVLRLRQDGAPILEVTLDTSGEFEYAPSFAGATSSLELETDGAADDLSIESVSILPYGAERLTLSDAGTVSPVRILDQARYNALGSRGAAGQPSGLLYTVGYPLGELRLDTGGAAGQILVLDVRIDRTRVAALDDTLALPDHAKRWLKYALADELAGQYGKSLTLRQLQLLEDAWNDLAGPSRTNALRVDAALRSRRSGAFNIDRGD